MTRSAGRPRGVLVAAALAMSVALTLTGCAAGQISQTANQVAAIDGGNGQIQKISVLDALFPQAPSNAGYAAGASVPLMFSVSNDGIDIDTLTGVSSPAAAGATLPKAVTLAPQWLTSFSTANQVVLTGLKAPLPYGKSVPVTFSFRSAGSLTINVPIQIPGTRDSDRPTVNIQPANPTPLWETGEKGSPAGTGLTPAVATTLAPTLTTPTTTTASSTSSSASSSAS